MEFVKSLKQTKIIKYIFIALIGLILLAISSKIKIPFYPVPMTMQTLVVLVNRYWFWLETWCSNYFFIFIRRNNWITCFFRNSRKRYRINLLHWTNNGLFDRFLVAGYISGKFNYDNNYFKTF